MKNKSILITCGPTWIPIDDTRIISNISSGRLGHLICDALLKAGAKVTLIQGAVLKPYENKKARIVPFLYYTDLQEILTTELKKKKYDAIIHAAAISDYKMAKAFDQKISSSKKTLTLKLVRTEKIINRIKKLQPKTQLVGFKLASKMSKIKAIEKSKKLFSEAKCDYVVANSTTQSAYKGYIINKEKQFLAHATSRVGIAEKLVTILKR